MIQSFRDLVVWQKAMDMAAQVYSLSERFPRSELFGFTAQLRRAALSVPSNIAEGKGIGGRGYIRHLRIALGSEAELQTQIELAVRLNFLSTTDADALRAQVSEVGRMMLSLLRSLLRHET